MIWPWLVAFGVPIALIAWARCTVGGAADDRMDRAVARPKSTNNRRRYLTDTSGAVSCGSEKASINHSTADSVREAHDHG